MAFGPYSASAKSRVDRCQRPFRSLPQLWHSYVAYGVLNWSLDGRVGPGHSAAPTDRAVPARVGEAFDAVASMLIRPAGNVCTTKALTSNPNPTYTTTKDRSGHRKQWWRLYYQPRPSRASSLPRTRPSPSSGTCLWPPSPPKLHARQTPTFLTTQRRPNRDADPGLAYKLQFKEWPESWEQAREIECPKGHSSATSANVPNLQPTCTYVLRLVAVSPEDGTQSAPGPEIVVDTQAADCTPKGSCCVS